MPQMATIPADYGFSTYAAGLNLAAMVLALAWCLRHRQVSDASVAETSQVLLTA